MCAKVSVYADFQVENYLYQKLLHMYGCICMGHIEKCLSQFFFK